MYFHKIRFENVLYALSFFSLLILSAIVICSHTFYIEWDAIAHYIPAAKSILVTGNLTLNFYRSLNFMEHPPAIPIIYAWLLSYSNLESLYSLAVIYFILTVLILILIARKVVIRNSLLVSLIFMSLPTVLIFISARSLYLDLPFVYYLLLTLYCTIKISENVKKGLDKSLCFDCLMFAIGSTLLILTRTEFGILLAPTLVIAFVFSLFGIKKNYSLIIPLMIGLSYYVREIRNIILDPHSSLFYVARLIPTLIVSGFIFLIIKVIKIIENEHNENEKRVDVKTFILITILVTLLTTPAIIYVLRNVIALGFVTPILPISSDEIIRSFMLFNKLNPSGRVHLVEMLRWDYFVSTWWLIPTYLIPITISIISAFFALINRTSVRQSILQTVLFFASIFMLWTNLSCDPQPRRLYYFAPFVAISATHGMNIIEKFFNPLGFKLRALTYVITLTAYTISRMKARTINDISLFYNTLYEHAIDIDLMMFSALIFLTIFIPYEILIERMKKNKISKRSYIIIMSLVLCFNLFLIATFIGPILAGAFHRYESIRQYHGGWLHYPDVVYYYTENVIDFPFTICFYCHELITFASKPIIDLSNPIYGMPIYSVISKTNESEILLRKMSDLNVRYFLKPKQHNPFFSMYEKLVNYTVLGSVLVDNPRLRHIATFEYVTLYAFHENYTLVELIPDKIIPWNYNPEMNYTLYVEQNTIKFTAMTNADGRIAVMYVFTQPIAVENALLINLRVHNHSVFFIMMFTNMSDRVTDYLLYERQVVSQTTKLVVNLGEGIIKGNFNQNSIQGILLGIKTKPNVTQTLEIYRLYKVVYDN